MKRAREAEEARLDALDIDEEMEKDSGFECTDPRCYVCGIPEGGMAEHEATVTFATLQEVARFK